MVRSELMPVRTVRKREYMACKQFLDKRLQVSGKLREIKGTVGATLARRGRVASLR